ncbi:MAG: hypothetical protein INF93_05140 [Rhodobacter sp.]|nr:hypothetical protein [Rhodobacter sp.]
MAGGQITISAADKAFIQAVKGPGTGLYRAYDRTWPCRSATLVPARVTRTFANDVAHVLDFHGTGVTPGHAFLCGAGRFQGRHVPLLDILRDDGAVVRQDGSLMRAATGCVDRRPHTRVGLAGLAVALPVQADKYGTATERRERAS